MKKIFFSFLIIVIITFISIGFFQYSGEIVKEDSAYKSDEVLLKEDSIPFNLANFRSFDLVVVILLISTATAGISNVLLVKKEGEKREQKQVI